MVAAIQQVLAVEEDSRCLERDLASGLVLQILARRLRVLGIDEAQRFQELSKRHGLSVLEVLVPEHAVHVGALALLPDPSLALYCLLDPQEEVEK